MIIADNVTKFFPASAAGTTALRDVSLEVGAGSVLGLLGSKGSGKTVLTKLLGLQDRPDSGAVKVDGVNTSRVDDRSLREIRRQFSPVDAGFLLLGERTVAGNIATPLEQLGVDGPRRRKKVADLLDLIGLSRAGASHPGELNEGQRRRVALARALATGPAVLTVDEPTAGLDEDQAAGVLATIDRARAELGVTVLAATADPGVVRKVCDSVAVLADGRLIESGPLLSLLTDASSETARALLPSLTADATDPLAFDRVADVVLIGHAAVDTVIPAAADRVGVQVTTLDGGTARIADTPVAQYRIGLSGDRADIALGWIAEHGGSVTDVRPARVAEVSELIARGSRSLAGVAA